MPAKSKSQQKLFGMALALEREKMPKKKASKKVKAISKGMSEEEIKNFAKTNHKTVMENHVLSFGQFINEDAYVDHEGKLQDLEFTPEEEFEINTYDNIQGISDFLEDSGARAVAHKMDGGLLSFRFKYESEPYIMQLDLDTDAARVARFRDSGESNTVIYHGSTDPLFDLIRANGLSFLQGY